MYRRKRSVLRMLLQQLCTRRTFFCDGKISSNIKELAAPGCLSPSGGVQIIRHKRRKRDSFPTPRGVSPGGYSAVPGGPAKGYGRPDVRPRQEAGRGPRVRQGGEGPRVRQGGEGAAGPGREAEVDPNVPAGGTGRRTRQTGGGRRHETQAGCQGRRRAGQGRGRPAGGPGAFWAGRPKSPGRPDRGEGRGSLGGCCRPGQIPRRPEALPEGGK
jgi:hypothetical protein